MEQNKKTGFSWNKLKFVRKIQLGFTFIGVISGLIALLNFYQINAFHETNNKIFKEFLEPTNKIETIYSDFQMIQNLMFKFSLGEYMDDFKSDFGLVDQKKLSIDQALVDLEQYDFGEDINQKLKQVSTIWGNYKNVVTDAVVSAAVTQQYEMAAIVTATSGQEVGNQMEAIFQEMIVTLSGKATELDKDMENQVASSQMVIIWGIIFGTIAFVLCTFFLAPALTKPINKLKEALGYFVQGNFNAAIDYKGEDEFGDLVKMVENVKVAQNEKIRAAEKIAEGVFEKVPLASDQDALAKAFNSEIETFELLFEENDKLIKANQEGNLGFRGSEDLFNGGWKKIIAGTNSILDAIVAPINEASQVLQSMAEGDLTRNMSGTYNGDYDTIKNNINNVINSLNQLLGEITESSGKLAVSVSDISASVEQMAAGASEQTTQANEIAFSVSEMTQTILENTQNASEASKIAKKAGDNATNGGKVVLKTIEGINRIAEIVVKSADTMKNLGASSDKIGEIIGVIEDIADQTNLLALNAAIEAARAGEHGRGFAVVADEVRKLAERTTKATKEIGQMIKQIQTDTNGAVESIKTGTVEAENGKELANEAGKSLEDIITNSERVTDIVNQLASASEEQSAAGEQISQNITSITNVTVQTAEGINLINDASETLNRQTDYLKGLIEKFKLATANGNGSRQLEYSGRDTKMLGSGNMYYDN